MLSKNKIDKKLKNYIKENLSKGYSKHAVRHVLVKHGYDENYVDGLIRKHSELQFVKVYSIFVSLLFIFSIFAFNLIKINQPQQITGLVAVSSGNDGCCTSICQQTSKNECYGKFIAGKKCNEIEECNVGCCIDKEGYCLTNYLSGNCITNYGTIINKDCRDLVFCRNITDKSYSSRLYSIKSKGAGIPSLKPAADYYKSSFNIQYYIYDKANVLSVRAEIKDNAKLIDSIELYDDGSHNDGAKNDNLYGNNWVSSRAKEFDGFKKFDVDIVVKYADDSQQSINKSQSIVVLSNNKCLPINNEWSASAGHGIILAAQNYEGLKDGRQKFESDAQNFAVSLFSIDTFSNNKDKFNIYRLEQSLSYFNIPTLVNLVSSYCPSYSNKKDLVVVLDSSEDYCVLESTRIARMNPQALFYRNITSIGFNESFANFCSYVLTPKKLADEIVAYATPPKITIFNMENITYNASAINLSFSISALNYPVNYSVLRDKSILASKILNEESEESIQLSLENGTNPILIKAVDRNRNKAFAPILLNATIQ